MSKLLVVAHDTLPELREKLRHAHDEAYKTRVKAVLLALQGKKRFEIVAHLTVDAKSVTTWTHRYNDTGTAGLISNKGGRKAGNPKWDASIFDHLVREIDTGGYWSIPRMQEWLRVHEGKDIPEQTVWYRLDQLGYTYKSARPHPMQGNKEQQECFKKGASSHSWHR